MRIDFIKENSVMCPYTRMACFAPFCPKWRWEDLGQVNRCRKSKESYCINGSCEGCERREGFCL